MHAEVGVDLGPGPIIHAVRGYTGWFRDLDSGRVVRAAPFQQGVDWLARELKAVGLERGQRAVLAISNGPLFPAMLCAVLERGASPVLAHSLAPASELRRVAMRFGASHVVCDRPAAADLAAAFLPVRTLQHAEWVHANWCAVDASDRAFTSGFPEIPAAPLHQTSGTTGEPKIAVRHGSAAVEEAAHYIQTSGIDHTDVIIATTPMSHAYAYGMGFMVPMLSGAAVVTMREFKPKTLLDAFADGGVTVFPAAPAMLEVILFGVGDRLRRSPRLVFAAGAPLSERVARAYREASGTIIRPLYGTTETGGITIGMNDRDGLTPGCVGPAMRGVDAVVRGAVAGGEGQAPLETLHIRSSSMMAGYLTTSGIDASPIADGWFSTGDLSHIDEHGSIHLRGRVTEVINVGGMKVVPSEVEEVIAGMQGVREVKVYAGNSASGAQFVKAAVVVTGAADGRAVREHCARELIYYKRPSAITVMESLPKTPSGKVILGQLP